MYIRMMVEGILLSETCRYTLDCTLINRSDQEYGATKMENYIYLL